MKNETVSRETLLAASSVPHIRIKSSQGLFSFELLELWEHLELLYFLIWRDVKVRYKQTLLGLGWAVLQPLVTMIIFTFIFGNLAQIPSDGIPYPIFAFAALLPWNYFSSALLRATNSIVGNGSIISKIYFPRLFLPLSGVVACIVDFISAFIILLGMMWWYHIGPSRGMLVLPYFILLAAATAFGVGLWLSALNAKYRDIGYLIPFIIQCWMYASPVAYSVRLVPQKWRLIYSLNPLVGVIEGFRWGLLGTAAPDFRAMTISTVIVAVLLLGGLIYFKRMEVTFADVV